jgi:glycosyltransferase involved in cell wall biosynthesis
MERILAVDGRAANEEQRAGIGNYCAGLLRELPRAAADAGWRLRVYLDAEPRTEFPVNGDEAEFRILPAGRLWTHRRLGAALRRERPDAFYAPGVQVPLLALCPCVATIYDLAVMRYPQEFTLKRRCLAQLELRHARRACAAFVAISGTTRDDFTDLLGAPPDSVTLAPPGCAPRFQPCADKATKGRLRRRMELKRPYLLYVGRIQPRKNLVRLMEAFDRVCARHPDWPHELVIAGARGWMDGPILDAATRLACADRVRLTGFVPDDDLPVLMAGAELFALVSLWEGFGMPLIEAMACGTPTITSNSSALDEVAGDAALRVDPEDTEAIACAVERLLADPALRAALAEKGLEQARQFTWAETARGVIRAANNAAAVKERTA